MGLLEGPTPGTTRLDNDVKVAEGCGGVFSLLA